MQHEITRAIPLLDSKGNLTEPGYAKKLLPVYRRADIKAGKMRIKEWDYYLVNNGRFALALTVDDNGYMGLDSISLLDFENGWEITASPMSFMPLGKLRMPETSAVGDVHHAGSGHSITFKNDGSGHRTLIAQMKKFGPAGSIYARVELFEEPEESMVICTPFDKPGHFYYNQKINCMRAKGEVVYDGKTYVFDPSDSFAVLDWGRGVWTYQLCFSAAKLLPPSTMTEASTPLPASAYLILPIPTVPDRLNLLLTTTCVMPAIFVGCA